MGQIIRRKGLMGNNLLEELVMIRESGKIENIVVEAMLSEGEWEIVGWKFTWGKRGVLTASSKEGWYEDALKRLERCF